MLSLHQDVLAWIKRTCDTCITWWRLSELHLGGFWLVEATIWFWFTSLLHKPFEPVIFEKFVLYGKKAKENKITNKSGSKSKSIVRQFLGWFWCSLTTEAILSVYPCNPQQPYRDTISGRWTGLDGGLRGSWLKLAPTRYNGEDPLKCWINNVPEPNSRQWWRHLPGR